MATKKKDYAVFTIRLARVLMDHGFKLKNTGVNYNYPTLKVYYFEDTIELRKVVAQHK